MFEYKCKLLRVIDGDTVDVDIYLGFGVLLRNTGVTSYMSIDKTDRGWITEMPVVYFLDWTEENIQKLVSDCKRKLYSQ